MATGFISGIPWTLSTFRLWTKLSTAGRVTPGSLPRGAHRSVREPLDSYGSCHPALIPPVNEQRWIPTRDRPKPGVGLCATTCKPLEFPHHPAHKCRGDVLQHGMELGATKPPVVVDPAGDDRIESLGQGVQAEMRASRQTPSPADSLPKRACGLATHRRADADEQFTPIVPR